MNWVVRAASIGLFALGMSVVFAQADTHTFSTYTCQHKSSDEVAKLLRPLLPRADAEPSVQLVVDREQNRLLLSGPSYVQRIAKQLLLQVDQPPPVKGGGGAQTVVSYSVASEHYPRFVEQLRVRLGEQVRVSRDASSGQVFVSATPAQHAFVRELSQPPPAGQHRLDDATRTNHESAVAASTVGPTLHPRFLRVPAAAFDRVQQQLLALFSSRFSIRNLDGRQIFILKTLGKVQQQLEIEFDRSRNGILVAGPAPALGQLVALVESLVGPGARGRSTKVFGLRRDNHRRLQDVIRQSGQVPQGVNTSSVPQRLPRVSDRAATVVPAAYLFADEDSVVSDDAVGGVGPVRQFEGVDVESLPDLDVIILRGPDEDLDQLADIIEQLERISRDTQPEIRVYSLQHTSSDSVAQMVEEVSGDLVGLRQGRVSVTPLVKPNALLLIGWGDAVAATLELIRELDQPVSPDSQSEVFRLRYAAANQVQQTLQAFFANRGGLGPQLRLAIDQNTNSLIVYAAPRDMEEVRRLIREIDVPEGQAVNRAQVFVVKHALAADVAQILQQAIQAAANGGDRPSSLELKSLGVAGQRVLRSGTLQNVQITPNPRNNSIIVSSPIENLELIGELIRQLDTPSGQAKIKVFRIVNGDASALIQTLRSLIPSQQGTGAPQLSATGEGGMAPLRFSVDTRSNSIIATGAEGDLRIVEALLVKLDQTTTMQRKTAVYRLKNSPAIDVANAVNRYLLNRRQLDNAIPGQTNPFAEIEREVVVVPEPIANKLILAATPRYFNEIQQLIEKLDESPPQVMIQVLIAEVALNKADEFGVELGLQDSVLFDRSLLGDLLTTSITEQTSTVAGIISTTQDLVQAASNVPGFAFNNDQPLGNSGSSAALAGAGNLGGQAISNFSVGRTNDQLGFGGMVLSASSKNVSILLRALRESRRVNVLSRPQIRTLDNQPAFIQVGQRVPRIVGSTVNQNGQSNSVSLENVGLILGVTPRVSPDGTVVMEIDAEKSSLGPEQDGIPVAVSTDGTVIRSPRVDTTTAQATVSAADGETIVLGGLITENGQYVHRSVPFLGDIPVLEHFFRYDGNIKRRSELLIILTPHVIRSSEDNERLRQLEMARMSWCARDVYELMDDVGFKPEADLDVEEGAPEVIYPDLNPTGEVGSRVPPTPTNDTEFRRSFESVLPSVERIPARGAQ